MTPAPRPATSDDLAAIGAIVHAAYSPYIARIGREPGPMLDDYPALVSSHRVHVIEHAGHIQAILVLIPEPGAMLLDNIAVAPSAQGTGLGRVLLRFAEQATRDAGYGSIRLYTNQAMTENLALYTRLGYAETHRAEVNGLKRVYMLKPLTAAPPS